jgi:hypothetical protein
VRGRGAGGLVVSAGTQTIILSTQQPLDSVAGRMISLPAAPTRDGRTWYMPVVGVRVVKEIVDHLAAVDDSKVGVANLHVPAFCYVASLPRLGRPAR